MNEKIKSLVRGLFEDKQAAKELEKSIDGSTSELKQWMSSKKRDEMLVDDIVVTYRPQVRSTMDESVTIRILKALAEEAETDEQREAILDCIGMKEYVCEEKLETLIYNNIISKDCLEPAVSSKTIYVLNLRKSSRK